MHHVLYHRQNCSGSQRVRDFIEQSGLRRAIEYKDVGDDPIAAEELAELIGKTQVPCLIFEGKPLLESDEIVHFLDRNFNQSSTVPL